jgi:hypothetical protein
MNVKFLKVPIENLCLVTVLYSRHGARRGGEPIVQLNECLEKTAVPVVNA